MGNPPLPPPPPPGPHRAPTLYDSHRPDASLRRLLRLPLSAFKRNGAGVVSPEVIQVLDFVDPHDPVFRGKRLLYGGG